MKNTQNKPGLFLLPSVLDHLISSLMVDVLEGSGLVGKEFEVASSIRAWPDATPTELASWLGMPPTTLSAILKRLEAKGLVARRRDPDDGRRSVLRVTAKGNRVLEKVLVRFRYWMQRVRDDLGVHPDEVLEPMRRLETTLRAALDQSTSANSASAGATATKVQGPPSRGQR